MIVINARFLTQKITGVQRYAIEICKRFPESIKEKKIILVAPKGELINKEELKFLKIEQFGNFRGHLWEQIDLVNFLNNNKNPILINFGGIGPLYYKNKITYVHDLAFKYYPETFSYIFQKGYNIFVPISVRNALKVITVSNYVKKDVENNFNINNLEVVYCAKSNHFKNLNLKREKINGIKHVVFHPNTIAYAIPETDPLAKTILNAEIGIVWHTSYRGIAFETMQAEFGRDITSKLKPTKKVWMVDAKLPHTEGAVMTAAQTKKVTEKLIMDTLKNKIEFLI